MTDFKEAFRKVALHIRTHYRIPVSAHTKLADGNTGWFGEGRILVDKDLESDTALFVLLHVFGHTLQWCLSNRLQQLGQEYISSPTDEKLKELEQYEMEASQYGLSLLHEVGITDMDQWVSDFCIADWRWLETLYRTGKRLDQREVKYWIEPGQPENILTALPIPEFKIKSFEARTAF